ncbi:Rho-GTPase-activating protein 5 [Verticillium dahliae VDG1]|nr:Rho-GTPase-activating protein 5 [Verticillium dahliae VDG1]
MRLQPVFVVVALVSSSRAAVFGRKQQHDEVDKRDIIGSILGALNGNQLAPVTVTETMRMTVSVGNPGAMETMTVTRRAQSS